MLPIAPLSKIIEIIQIIINGKFAGLFIRKTTDMRKPLRSVFPFQLLTLIRMQTLSEPFLFLTVIV